MLRTGQQAYWASNIGCQSGHLPKKALKSTHLFVVAQILWRRLRGCEICFGSQHTNTTSHRCSFAKLCSQHALAELVTCMPAVLRDHERSVWSNIFRTVPACVFLCGQLLFLHTLRCLHMYIPLAFAKVSRFSACGFPRTFGGAPTVG